MYDKKFSRKIYFIFTT